MLEHIMRSPRATDRLGQDSLSNRCQTSCYGKLQWQSDFTRISIPWLRHAIQHWNEVTVKHKDDHLDQALLYQDADLEVLLHCFDKAGVQSFIHNHRASFLSCCLSGQYVEKKWKVDLHSAGSHIECVRQPDGKLGRPLRRKGQLEVLHETTFSAGQCKPVLHAELHSISSVTKDAPVTLVVRHKDKVAKARVTTCYMDGCHSAVDLSHALLTGPEDDRPASQAEKSEMLKVLKGVERQLRVHLGFQVGANTAQDTLDRWHLVLLTRGLLNLALQQ